MPGIADGEILTPDEMDMKQNQPTTAAGTGGKYYPRKMRRGWCVAHHVTACGITIERFGARTQSYREAFERAERMNREEAGTELPLSSGEGKEAEP